ncbi:ABC transporter ATP-binding protein [Fusobacterium mortiferum]|uniref:ABC transporter ATP-binding protein n=1 Tax=Fusobacterium mortiferum TaxID=850 RepID=UPI00195BD4B5|nr:ABC transporter ATP-binding protein [Fusobacterium mortiferum]
MKEIYSLKSLTKSYGERKVFENIDLEIRNDEITIILGKSGCGKTTLMRILSKLDRDITGEVKFCNTSGVEISGRYGFVFQESRLLPWFNVEENISIHGRVKDIDIYLDMIGLKEYRYSYPEELSGGMAQRVAIARALSYEPDTLFMDEPFSALDYFTRRQLHKELLKIHKATGIGVIFVTHNLDEALTLAHRILLIKDGKILDFKIDKDFPREIDDIELVRLKSKIIKLIES